MELLIDRLSVLLDADVSRDEVLRQLKELKPNLRKGSVLDAAQVLVGNKHAQETKKLAHKFLEDVICLEESYITSAGPLGTTSEEVTIWEHPQKPTPFIGLAVVLACILLGVISFVLSGPDYLFLILFLGLPASIIMSMARTVANNKYRARQRLSDKILQSARSFELMLDRVYE